VVNLGCAVFDFSFFVAFSVSPVNFEATIKSDSEFFRFRDLSDLTEYSGFADAARLTCL
jgi:hypothetical protein